jgi:hypothetical protein
MKSSQKKKQQEKQKSSPDTKGKRFWWIMGVLMVLSATVVVLWPGSKLTTPANPPASTPPSPATQNDTAGQERLVGRWLRADGGYILEIRSAAFDGKLEAGYFNPNPIHVARAEWQHQDNRLMVVVELRDVNYPGSTYTLEFLKAEDRMVGAYYQAVEGVTYEVEFVRKK